MCLGTMRCHGKTHRMGRRTAHYATPAAVTEPLQHITFHPPRQSYPDAAYHGLNIHERIIGTYRDECIEVYEYIKNQKMRKGPSSKGRDRDYK